MANLITTGAGAGNATKVASAAIEQGTTWGTPVAVGAGDGFHYTGESIAGGREALVRNDIGFAWEQAPDIGSEMHRGVLTLDMYHGGGCGRLLSYIFGTSGSPTQTPPSTGTTYLHKLTLIDALTVFATLCLAKRNAQKWWEYGSVQARRLVLSGSARGRVTAQIEFVGTKLDRDSSTNTTTQTDAVTVPTRRKLLYNQQGLFRINAQAGGALASTTDDLAISAWTLTIERPLSEDFQVDGTTYIRQPGEDGPSSAMLDVTFRSYDAETWIAAYLAQTEYKADLKFLSGSTPTSGSEMYVLLNFARLIIAEQPQAAIGGRGRVSHSVKFRCAVPASAPTGMTSLTTALEMQILDEVTSAYLA